MSSPSLSVTEKHPDFLSFYGGTPSKYQFPVNELNLYSWHRQNFFPSMETILSTDLTLNTPSLWFSIIVTSPKE